MSAETIVVNKQDHEDLIFIAESFTGLVRCKGGRIKNSNRGGYTCLHCGSDTDDGQECKEPKGVS